MVAVAGESFLASRHRREAYAHLRKVELANVGTQGAALTQSQRAEYIDCVKELEPYNVSLREAIKMLVPTLAARRQSVNLETAVAAMIAAQKEDGASGRHIEDLRSRLGQLQRAFPGRLLATISSVEIDDWLRRLSVASITRNNFRRVVGRPVRIRLREKMVRRKSDQRREQSESERWEDRHPFTPTDRQTFDERTGGHGSSLGHRCLRRTPASRNRASGLVRNPVEEKPDRSRRSKVKNSRTSLRPNPRQSCFVACLLRA